MHAGTNPGSGGRPRDFTPALGPGWGKVVPFAMNSGTQFRPPPPPALSAECAAAFNEVKSLGAKESSTRTPSKRRSESSGATTAGHGTAARLQPDRAKIAALRGNS